MKSLVGDIGNLYILGLQTGVPDVTIITSWDADHEDLDTSVVPLRPVQLYIKSDERTYDVGWLSTAMDSSCQELVRLDLEFTIPDDDSFPQHQAGIVSFVGSAYPS